MELSKREMLLIIDSIELRIEGLEYDIANGNGDIAIKDELTTLYNRLRGKNE